MASAIAYQQKGLNVTKAELMEVGVTFRKSSSSTDDKVVTTCVEIAHPSGRVAIADSKQKLSSPVLLVPRAAFGSLLKTI